VTDSRTREWAWSRARVGAEYGMTAAALIGLVAAIAGGAVNVFVAGLLVVVLFYASRLVRMPTRIRLRDDDIVEFANPLRSEQVPVADIERVAERRRGRKGGEVIVHHANGELRMLNWFKDLDAFFFAARERNPEITR
jgi:hypothetical protein